MANKFGTNPMYIDAVFTNTASMFGKSRIFIKHIIWNGATTVGHKLTLTDGDGDIIVDLTCDTANESVVVNVDTWVHGLACTVINSGNAQIFVG